MLVCPMTTRVQVANDFRVQVLASAANGLHAPSWIAIDKLSLVGREKVGAVLGQLELAFMEQVDRTLALVLGLA